MTHAPILVIGYGNTLRSDDGVGYRVAETVADWNRVDVRSLPLHQLTPDLAEVISTAQVVIFVDASVIPATTLQIETLQPDTAPAFTGHVVNPRSLLALSQALYGHVPIAYHLLIPVTSVAFGETFSAVTQANFAVALREIQDIVDRLNQSLITP
ncbi:MAG TPA: hydrogenase maturation protease [Crinalium sp.]|jgi:hydrogenase maturation protease